MDPMYGLNGGAESDRYSGYGYETGGRGGVSPTGPPNGTSGSTALYHHNGSRYGLGNPGRGHANGEAKMNGLHGPKHKRGDIDRECMWTNYVFLLCAKYVLIFQSIGLPVLAWKISRERLLACVRTNMGVGTCRRNWRKVLLSIVT